MTIESFDDDGRRNPIREEPAAAAGIASIVLLAGFGGVLVAWVLDANLSPWDLVRGAVLLALMAGAFGLQHHAGVLEKRDLEAELARERRANERLHQVYDDATGMADQPSTGDAA